MHTWREVRNFASQKFHLTPVHKELPNIANNSSGCLGNLTCFRLESFLYIWYILYRCL